MARSWQVDDFSPPLDPLPMWPATNGSETSQLAAERVAPHVTEQQRQILDAIAEHGPMTRSELALVTGLRENSINGRCSPGELSHPLHPMLCIIGRRDGREVLDLTPYGSQHAKVPE